MGFCPDSESLLTVVTRLAKWSIPRGGAWDSYVELMGKTAG